MNVSLDDPSGEGDKIAEELILGNKDRYNQELAEFIKTHEIDKVFCFSFRVFDMGLPEAPALFPDVFKKVTVCMGMMFLLKLLQHKQNLK